jgi:hypothetical protein
MSVSINNLFNYSRSLPVPFDTMTNKKVKVASMYGAKTESTLCGSVIKAVHAMCRCMNGTGEGAVGQIDTNKSVAEYKSSVGPDAYHLVVQPPAALWQAFMTKTPSSSSSTWRIRASGTARQSSLP